MDDRKCADLDGSARVAAALARGFLARRRAAALRRAREESARSDGERASLRRRLHLVSSASKLVASFLSANVALQKRRRARELSAAVARVSFLSLSLSSLPLPHVARLSNQHAPGIRGTCDALGGGEPRNPALLTEQAVPDMVGAPLGPLRAPGRRETSGGVLPSLVGSDGAELAVSTSAVAPNDRKRRR